MTFDYFSILPPGALERMTKPILWTTTTTTVTPRVADPEPGYDFVPRKRKRKKGKR